MAFIVWNAAIFGTSRSGVQHTTHDDGCAEDTDNAPLRHKITAATAAADAACAHRVQRLAYDVTAELSYGNIQRSRNYATTSAYEVLAPDPTGVISRGNAWERRSHC